jgi:hypothetical protein
VVVADGRSCLFHTEFTLDWQVAGSDRFWGDYDAYNGRAASSSRHGGG